MGASFFSERRHRSSNFFGWKCFAKIRYNRVKIKKYLKVDLTVKREDEGSEGLMCGNFKFLEGKTEFESFAAACLEAEKGRMCWREETPRPMGLRFFVSTGESGWKKPMLLAIA